LSSDRSGRLVAFEGIEGAGKSTHIRLAATSLADAGHRVRTTTEPGGTGLGRALRELLLHRRDDPPAPLAELFLYLADRTQHVVQIIGPALAAGEIVLTDRFSASTIAYQGHARGLNVGEVTRVDAWARQGVTPDLNILLDCPVEVGLTRAREDDRFHSEVRAFHDLVRQGFLTMAAADPEHWHVIDATRTTGEVHQRVMEAMRACLANP